MEVQHIPGSLHMDGVSSDTKGSCAIGLLERDLRDQVGEVGRWEAPERMFLLHVMVNPSRIFLSVIGKPALSECE